MTALAVLAAIWAAGPTARCAGRRNRLGALFTGAELKQPVGEMPTPDGTLSIEMTDDPWPGPVRGPDMAAAPGQHPRALWPLAEGVRFDIEFLNR